MSRFSLDGCYRTRILLILAPFMVSACNSVGDQATRACETFVKEGLRSPSTYKKIEASFSGSSFEQRGIKQKIVSIKYDAANAFGTPIRSEQLCAFEVDEKGVFVEDLDHAARMSSIGADEYSECCILDKSESKLTPEEVVADAEAAAKEAEKAADEAMKAAEEASK